MRLTCTPPRSAEWRPTCRVIIRREEAGQGASRVAHPAQQHDRQETVLRRAFFLIAGFMLVEVAGGILANSLTLLADAGHMFLDATALGLAWGAMHLSRRSGDARLSYGYHRFQVLAAFLNGLTLAALVVWILFEAYERIRTPQAMIPIPALIVASVGFAVNLVAWRWLHGGRQNANVRAAALHVLGDLLGSAAAIVAAAVVYFTGWTRVDPILALIIAFILGRGAWRVLRDAAHILLEGVPKGLDLRAMRDTLGGVQGVVEVHHVHAWSLCAELPLVTLHARVEEPADTQPVVQRLKAVLLEEFGIDHSTIQVEHGPCPDERAAADGAPASIVEATASVSGAPAGATGALAATAEAPAGVSGVPTGVSQAPAAVPEAPAADAGAIAGTSRAPAATSGTPATMSGASATNSGRPPAAMWGTPAAISGKAPEATSGENPP